MNTILSSLLTLLVLDRGLHVVLDNFPCALSAGAQMSQECKAETQYLLLAIHQLLLDGLSSLVREQGEYEDTSEAGLIQ